jgi:glycosyltransferase involved in cell wall biosynthesis
MKRSRDTPAPELTVVIPTRNRWKLAARAVKTALAQAGVGVEVVVVDDGSDESPPPGFPSHPSVRVLRSDTRQGVAAARNKGLAAAVAPWIAFLDDDDLWAPPRLRVLTESAGERRAQFAYSSAIIVDEKLRPLLHLPAPEPDSLLPTLLQRNAIPGGGSGMVARTELVRQLEGFDEALSFAADWDLWIRLAEAAEAAAVSEPLTAYTHGAASWVLSGDPAIHDDLELLEAKHRPAAERAGVAVDHRAFDRYVASSLWLAGNGADAVRAYLTAARRHRDPAAVLYAARAAIPRTAKRPRRAPPDPQWLAEYRRQAQHPGRAV